MRAVARSGEEICRWTLLVPVSTYVFLPALLERISCLDHDTPLLLGRLAGRLNPKSTPAGASWEYRSSTFSNLNTTIMSIGFVNYPRHYADGIHAS